MASAASSLLLRLSPTTAPRSSSNFCLTKPHNVLLIHTLERNTQWLGTQKLRLKFQHTQPTLKPITATISFSLPTAKPDRVSDSDKVPKWSSKAIKSFAMSELEARKLKYLNTGTEALLMGILVEGTSLASKFLRANGIQLLKVREEIVKLLGKADMFTFSPEHPPLTEAAQRALDLAIDEKLRSGKGEEITASDLLLAVWSEKDAPGHKIMAALGFNDEKAAELKSLSSETVLGDD